MIKLILILGLQIASHKQQTIPAHELCANKPDIRYQIDDDLICLPIDEIFKNGFEEYRK